MNKKWIQSAEDTYNDLKNIDPTKASKEDFLLMGACVALLDHEEGEANTGHPEQQTAAVDAPSPAEEPAPSHIESLMLEMLDHFKSYMENKSMEQLRNSPHHGDYAEDDLRKLLKVEAEIAEALYRTADAEERKLIGECWGRIAQKVR